ncbi:unnamed protein product [Protopolystoma xenopodis]|uniref:Glutathione peroxidase n=1 Tax=Protopolystoma xenopodis TaxID=117903 RepID=A0A3S5C3C6_9PLAT|nr:unnamed protein product [Protopolystoma xenopodis]
MDIKNRLASSSMAKDIYQFKANDIDGNEKSLADYKFCAIIGLTDKNYRQLQEMHTSLHDKGLRILAFPCNQFGSQEPGTNLEIKEFATSKYSVTFDMFEKINVNGKSAHPLFTFLKRALPGFITNDIKWNFSKFLTNRDGIPFKRYSPQDEPLSLLPDIEHLIQGFNINPTKMFSLSNAQKEEYLRVAANAIS